MSTRIDGQKDDYIYIKGTRFRRDQILPSFNGKPMHNVELVVDKNKIEKEYVVRLVDGTVVSLPEQPKDSNASVIIGKNGSVHFDNIRGGTVFDTPQNDKYTFTRCEEIHVKAKRDETNTMVFTSPSTFIPVGSCTTTSSEDKDTIDLMLCKNMKVGYTRGYDALNTNSSIFIKKNK